MVSRIWNPLFGQENHQFSMGSGSRHMGPWWLITSASCPAGLQLSRIQPTLIEIRKSAGAMDHMPQGECLS